MSKTTNANTTKAKKAPASGRVRGKNWSEEEQLHLMDVLQEIKPINPDEWERVKSQHDIAFPGFNRTVATLQRVYSDLARVVEPTGDPNIPRPVKKAKEIRELIREKTDGTTGSPDADEVMDEGGEGDDNSDDDDDDDSDDDDEVIIEGTSARNNNNISFESNGDDEGEDEGDQLADFFVANATIGDGMVPSVIRATNVSHSTAGVAVAGGRRGGSVGSVTSSTVSVAARGSTPAAVSSKAAKAKAAFNRRTAGAVVPAASPKFRNQLQSMKTAPVLSRPSKSRSDDDGFSFQNMMGMMMMQQQQEREAAREERAFHAQQAREDRTQQQQFMSMMMMTMVGGGKKRARSDDDDDDDNDDSRKSPRKSPRKGKGN